MNATSLLGILEKYDPEEVFKAIDVIEHKKMNGDVVNNFAGLLVSMLKHGIILPASYIPRNERKRKEEMLKKAKELEAIQKSRLDAESEAQRIKAEELYTSLSTNKKHALCNQAKMELPPVLHGISQCVHVKMLEILTRDIANTTNGGSQCSVR